MTGAEVNAVTVQSLRPRVNCGMPATGRHYITRFAALCNMLGHLPLHKGGLGTGGGFGWGRVTAPVFALVRQDTEPSPVLFPVLESPLSPYSVKIKCTSGGFSELRHFE